MKHIIYVAIYYLLNYGFPYFVTYENCFLRKFRDRFEDFVQNENFLCLFTSSIEYWEVWNTFKFYNDEGVHNDSVFKQF